MLKLLFVCVEDNPITERRRAEHFAKKYNSRMTINNRRGTRYIFRYYFVSLLLKKNLNAPRPSEHPPVRGKKCQLYFGIKVDVSLMIGNNIANLLFENTYVIT